MTQLSRPAALDQLDPEYSAEYLRHDALTKQLRNAMGDRYIPWLRGIFDAYIGSGGFIAYSTAAHEAKLAEIRGAIAPDNVTLQSRAATIQADLASGELGDLSCTACQEALVELIGIQNILQRDGEALSDYGDAKAQAERWGTPL